MSLVHDFLLLVHVDVVAFLSSLVLELSIPQLHVHPNISDFCRRNIKMHLIHFFSYQSFLFFPDSKFFCIISPPFFLSDISSQILNSKMHLMTPLALEECDTDISFHTIADSIKNSAMSAGLGFTTVMKCNYLFRYCTQVEFCQT